MLDYFNNVLFIAPNYKLRKGGIASVLKLYEESLKQDFNYSASIYFQNVVISSLLFPINILEITIKLLLYNHIKLVHIHGSHGGSFIRKYIIYILAKKLLKKKVVYHMHSSHFYRFYDNASNWMKHSIERMINNVDVLVVLSEEWHDYFQSTFKPKRVEILENVVSKQKEVITNKKEGSLKVLFLGRIGDRKGVFDLLDTLDQNLDTALSTIELTIGGDGEVNKLLNEIKTKNLTNIKFVGWTKGDEKEKLLTNCNVFILPSYDEGLPISILEAMSYGKAIIATNIGGIPRILKDKENGFMIEPGNKRQIWEALLKYLNNEGLLQTHGLKSLEIVEDYFPAKVLSKLNSIYEEML